MNEIIENMGLRRMKEPNDSLVPRNHYMHALSGKASGVSKNRTTTMKAAKKNLECQVLQSQALGCEQYLKHRESYQ